MELILAFIFFLIFCSPSSKSCGSSHSKNSHSSKKGRDGSFDPYDTFYLEDGLEHEMDDDGYCEECDDYHDYV